MRQRQDRKHPSAGALQAHIRSMLVLERLCTRFHVVVRELGQRPADRATFSLGDERDVVDLFRALLALDFESVLTEAWSTEGGPRTGFILPLERIAVTVRLAVSDLTAEALAVEVADDARWCGRRPGCRTLVSFVYDPAGQIAQAPAIETALNGERGGLAVRVFIAPKQRPAAPAS